MVGLGIMAHFRGYPLVSLDFGHVYCIVYKLLDSKAQVFVEWARGTILS